MWDPQRLTTLCASTACYRDSFTVTCDNNINVEIDHTCIMAMGNKGYYGKQNLLRSELLRKDTKCKIYKTHINLLYFIVVRTGHSLNKCISRPGRHVGFCGGTKWRRGRFPPSTSVSPAKFIPPIAPKNHLHHHHQLIIEDMYNRPNGQTSTASV
jgi:hypothetical protein